MKIQDRQLVIIGAGPAGMAAAIGAHKSGVRDILILERDRFSGGILNQCIHNGFGLHIFKSELTGPEYAARYKDMIKQSGIECLYNTMVLQISPDRMITAVNENGLLKIKAGAVILACGCRERPRGALNLAGSRGAGILSAGTAQRLINIEGCNIGSKVFILGSGDIGLIMARRMVFTGAKVLGVAEIMPYSSGLKRNIVQCLDDFDIPLFLNHTVISVRGKDRIKSVIVSQVDENKRAIKGTEKEFLCDTLLLSVGLIPENELAKNAGISLDKSTGGAIVDNSFMTNLEGVFVCGNVLHVHDLVDHVSGEAFEAGKASADYLSGLKPPLKPLNINAGAGVRYVVPQIINQNDESAAINFKLRTDGVYKDSAIKILADDKVIFEKKRAILTPGEMEVISLNAQGFAGLKSAQKSEICIGGGQ